MKKPFRVALALRNDSILASMDFFLGTHQFARQRSDWKIVWQGGTSQLTWETALESGPDGILGLLPRDVPLPLKKKDSCHVVILNNAECMYPLVATDGRGAGRRAATHLIKLHLKHFAYVGHSGYFFSEQRKAGFLEGLKTSGHGAEVPTIEWTGEAASTAKLRAWVKSLPRPCGLLCADDLVALRLIEICLKASINIPEELAVLGIGNHERICLESPIPISSIEQHFRAIGWRAASLLDDLLRGKTAPTQPILVPPGEVIVRESTKMFGIEDPLVRRALNIIHAEHQEPLTVPSLLVQLGNVSQRLLNLRFQQHLNRSPYQEILRNRILQAQRLLRSTRLSQEEIAHVAGFYDPAQFSRHFRKISLQTPSEYRKKADRTPGLI